MYRNVTIIAEAKTKSPFVQMSERSWDREIQTAIEIGDIVSVHTDPRWGGSLDLVKRARRLTDKPILAKGIHSTDGEIRSAFRAGADHVLVVGRVPDFNPDLCFVEPYTLIELENLPQGTKVVWNLRNLNDPKGGAKVETFEQARELWGGWLCQASFVETVDDIKPGTDAVLVGTNLQEFARSLVRD